MVAGMLYQRCFYLKESTVWEVRYHILRDVNFATIIGMMVIVEGLSIM